MSFKIAFIGAGSVGFTRKLIGDLLTVPEFSDVHLALMDISEQNVDMIRQLVERDVEANGLRSVTLTATTDRREALRDARYVFCTFRVGGLEAFRTDIDIPLRYGIDQCVGDTLCAGGIMYAQRGIPAILEICADIEAVAERGCRLFNYANPMAMMTWAAIDHGGVDTVGLCHGVQGGHRQMADALGVPQNELDIVAAGINHQTWYVKVSHFGKDMLPQLLETYENDPTLRDQEKVRIDMLRRFGYYSTESNGHLSEYLAWYRKRPDEISEWINLDRWILGETGGYLRSCSERRNWFEQDFPRWLSEPPMRYEPDARSSEHGSYILEGLETGRIYRGHFNVRNHGVITNLPDDAIIEAPGYVDRTGINIPHVGDLPLGCAAVCNQSISVQRLGVAAAVSGDDQLLRQAMLLDPLTGAVCNPPEVWQLVDDLLVGQEQWLPQYGAAIAAAKHRIETEPRLPTREWNGAARLQERDVESLRGGETGDAVLKTEEMASRLGRGR